jgi:hypothetical protein
LHLFFKWDQVIVAFLCNAFYSQSGSCFAMLKWESCLKQQNELLKNDCLYLAQFWCICILGFECVDIWLKSLLFMYQEMYILNLSHAF